MEPETKSNGALIGLVVIIIILVIGGVYIWQSNKDALEKKQSPAESEVVTDQDSADLDALELDAEAIDATTGVDADAVN
ncbi:hypothetical protein A3H53_04250 [Candidatus Nomurabacteria bacterium RIFCSPLOWO2_02_FULL_40_10]|uniref:Uncharacterized protein n=2 Tax=Candidatus Nomuraibacteriota TaxID=1752729 RepID=A0A1F6XW98_9BACT|nr:MAG: hypothetical protein A2642_00355 [Candidatus Nomurabacteria bacterium RIFCSPHIGHO2_01_FULL_39_10]OGI98392.1 MAG: hypothetical protein A3H53_04250 [Candidatus Nomurabacteria bacterium RIFCSPLOWO2_02_FULL_40_10]